MSSAFGGPTKVSARVCYVTLFLMVWVIAIPLIVGKFVEVALFAAIATLLASLLMVRSTAARLSFFDRKTCPGEYNLLYLWAILAGAMIINGAEVIEKENAAEIFAFTFLCASLLVLAGYAIINEHWNGSDTWRSVITASCFASFGFVLCLLNILNGS